MKFVIGDVVTVKETVPNRAYPSISVKPGTPCTIRDQIENVVMIVPGNSGHEVITLYSNIKEYRE